MPGSDLGMEMTAAAIFLGSPGRITISGENEASNSNTATVLSSVDPTQSSGLAQLQSWLN